MAFSTCFSDYSNPIIAFNEKKYYLNLELGSSVKFTYVKALYQTNKYLFTGSVAIHKRNK